MINITQLIDKSYIFKTMGLTNELIFKIVLQKNNIEGHREKSLINTNERTPSLFIYYNKENNDYYYKDFSSGQHGDAIDYIAYKFFNGDIHKACMFVFSYANKIENLSKILYEHNIKRKEHNINIRSVISNLYKNTKIQINGYAYDEYWNIKYAIDRDIIYQYGVLSITLIDEEPCCSPTYLYTDKDGSFVQIYRPFSHDKFRTMQSVKHIPYGIQWLNPNKHKHAIICSCIKDMINTCQYLKELSLNNTYIPITYLSEKPLKENDILYLQNIGIDKIYVLYDYDKHGLENSNKSCISNNIINITDKTYNNIPTDKKIDISDTRTNPIFKEQIKQNLYNLLTN